MRLVVHAFLKALSMAVMRSLKTHFITVELFLYRLAWRASLWSMGEIHPAGLGMAKAGEDIAG